MNFHKSLNSAEKERYQRHLILPDFGMEGQLKLKNARILVIGAGGLGCPVLQYLAAAGVGTIGIVDFDTVDISNLQRQILYSVEDIGRAKVQVAKSKLEQLNPEITILPFETPLDINNVFEIMHDFDIIVDGTDNFNTRYLVNDACVLLNKVNVFGSVFRFEGQVSVFNYLQKDGSRGVNYRDLFPKPPAEGFVPNCAEGGVLGVLPGIIGSMQANEAIKVITGIGGPLVNRMWVFDAAYFSSHIINIKKNPAINITELPTDDAFCEISNIPSISVATLKSLIAEKVDFQLIDVRETNEYNLQNIGGKHIPLSNLLARANEIETNKKVIIHCQTGKRSRQAIELLQKEKGLTNLWNLESGLTDWLFP